MASVKSVDIPVLELSDIDKLLKALLDKSIEAIERDGAQAIILGCTGMIGVDELLSQELEEKGYSVRIISCCCIYNALESLIKLNISQSKRAYIPPRDKDQKHLEPSLNSLNTRLSKEIRIERISLTTINYSNNKQEVGRFYEHFGHNKEKKKYQKNMIKKVPTETIKELIEAGIYACGSNIHSPGIL